MPRASVDEHAALVRSLIVLPNTHDTVPLADARGRVTGLAVFSPVDLPLFRNSQMDGFAVHYADLHALPATLPIVGEIAAQAANPEPLAPGTAVRIMTGAVVPEGADAVVPVEDTTVSGAHVTVLRGRARGEFVRDRGSDLNVGDELLPGGLTLAARHLAVLAAAGLAHVSVRSQLRVAVITTGAELIPPGSTALLGQVFDANSVALVAAVQAAGANVSVETRVGDNPDDFRAALEMAAARADLILTSGGISMGDHEVVRDVLEPLGATVTTIAMQPGGPQATAVFAGAFATVPVICFPGNPVSTQLSFEVFVAPVLREYAGVAAAVRTPHILNHSLDSPAGKRQFLRGRSGPNNTVSAVSGPGSHLIAGLAAANMLIDIPADTIAFNLGDTVQTVLL